MGSQYREEICIHPIQVCMMGQGEGVLACSRLSGVVE